MREISRIKEKLTSDDQEALALCDEYLDQRIEKERQRGASAENRANIILTATGAASAFLIFFFDKLTDLAGLHSTLVTLTGFSAALFLSKSLFYSIKSISCQSKFSVDAENIIEFQAGSRLDVVRNIIACKLWELKHSIHPNTMRLFYVQRAQRALIVFIAFLVFSGFILLFKNVQISECVEDIALVYVSFLALFFLFFDKVLENNGIWKFQ